MNYFISPLERDFLSMLSWLKTKQAGTLKVGENPFSGSSSHLGKTARLIVSDILQKEM
jgi:hypothetical protein